MGKLTVDGEAYEFDFDRITNVEAMEIQKISGMKFGEWIKALSEEGDMLAMTALVYVVQKRREPTLRFDDVTFTLGGLDIEFDEEEEGPGKDAAGDTSENSNKKSTNTRSRSRGSTV